jgi:hypothetical protein
VLSITTNTPDIWREQDVLAGGKEEGRKKERNVHHEELLETYYARSEAMHSIRD